MTGLSCFIISINYETKNFSVIQEFMISRGLRTNNPLFSNIPVDANNYDDVIPAFKIQFKLIILTRIITIIILMT